MKVEMKLFANKAFFWGVFIASFTWFITIALYIRISRRPDNIPTYNDLQHDPTEHLDMKLKPIFPTILNEYGLIRSPEDQYVRDMGYKHHAFNALVSNNIGLYRNIPDTRHKVCPRQNFEQNLPTASIIMCFYNEHKMTLLRSVNTILKRTPPEQLYEIILVDDFSDFDDLKTELINNITNIDTDKKVKIIHNEKREGLIRARVIGARQAKGDILIFLDSHIEVNNDWAQPLLTIIKNENSTLAVPVIDIINADTFEYASSPLVRGGFNWGLHFKWDNLPEGTLINEQSFSGPFLSPTMAGGLFAVNRQYFQYIGEYDMGMDIWGGENLEISFRVWQCGGAIKIIPCSRIGHVFRKRRPYSAPDGSNTMLRNSMRLAYVWMDDYKDIFVKRQKLEGDFNFGDIQDRIDLREKLNCQSFSWYLTNIYPELEIPGVTKNSNAPKAVAPNFQPWHQRKRKYINNFMLRLSNTSLCISVNGSKVKGMWKRGSTLALKPCKRDKSQLWYETDKAEIIIDKLYCMEASYSPGSGYPVLGKCHEMQSDQEWRHIKANNSPIYNTATGTCLRTKQAIVGAPVFLDLCSKETNNAWDFL